MEVLLKKTKITPSILKQSLKSTSADFKNGTVLGWCIYNKQKYIVCFREDLNSISSYMMFKNIEKEGNISRPNDLLVKVSFGGNYVPANYKFDTEIEASEFIITFQNAKNEAERKGQFYL